jgi:hypothetical protein
MQHPAAAVWRIATDVLMRTTRSTLEFSAAVPSVELFMCVFLPWHVTRLRSLTSPVLFVDTRQRPQVQVPVWACSYEARYYCAAFYHPTSPVGAHPLVAMFCVFDASCPQSKCAAFPQPACTGTNVGLLYSCFFGAWGGWHKA